MMIEWFDDLKLGMRFKSEGMAVSKDDIIRFAAEYDPQPFHLDEEAAKKTMLGGLAASGWHTANATVICWRAPCCGRTARASGSRRWLWLEFSDPDSANREARRRGQKRMSRQLWHLGKKIMEVDAFMRADPSREIREVHP